MRVHGAFVRLLCVASVVTVLVHGPVAGAGAEPPSSVARVLYEEGRLAFEAGDFVLAFGRFRRAYLVTPLPALRYNMAAALERLDRRNEAADELRGYLMAVPEDPNRAAIESRVRALESAQPLEQATRLDLLPGALRSPRPPTWRRWWPWTILAVGVGAGVALGLGFGLTRGVATTLPATGPGLALRF